MPRPINVFEPFLVQNASANFVRVPTKIRALSIKSGLIMTQMNYSRRNPLRIVINEISKVAGQLAGIVTGAADDLSDLALSTTTSVIVTDDQGKIACVSPGFTTLTGFTAKDVVGQTPAMALHGQHTDFRTVEVLRARCKAGEPFGINILLYARDNRPMWVTSKGRPVVRGGRFRGYVITQTAIIPKAADDTNARPVPTARATAA